MKNHLPPLAPPAAFVLDALQAILGTGTVAAGREYSVRGRTFRWERNPHCASGALGLVFDDTDLPVGIFGISQYGSIAGWDLLPLSMHAAIEQLASLGPNAINRIHQFKAQARIADPGAAIFECGEGCWCVHTSAGTTSFCTTPAEAWQEAALARWSPDWNDPRNQPYLESLLAMEEKTA